MSPHTPAPPTILIAPGLAPGELTLRVSQELVDELAQLLRAAHLDVTRGAEFSAEPWLEILHVVVEGTWPAAMAAAINAFLARNKDKQVILGAGEERVEITGHSAKDVERIMAVAADRLALREEAIRRAGIVMRRAGIDAAAPPAIKDDDEGPRDLPPAAAR
jgi:hypothetical protein